MPQAARDSILSSVKVEVLVALGTARPTMAELSSMSVDTVLSLDCQIDDPVELYVGNRLIAEGVLEEAEGSANGDISVRVSKIFDQAPARR
jgi:flagellar motor switch protein FliN/FliY